MSELASWNQRFVVLHRYLAGRLADQARRAEPRAEVVEAWKWIAWHRGGGSRADLARHVYLSERQLTAVFTAELGLPPKAVSRLMRFEHARQRIEHAVQTGGSLDLSAAAHACGYYDHALPRRAATLTRENLGRVMLRAGQPPRDLIVGR